MRVPKQVLFDDIIEIVLAKEGGFQNKYKDRGNWTSGVIGVGELKGTKFGITAMTYPFLDIRNLTREQAVELYRKDWWEGHGLMAFPSQYRLLFFDMLINHGFRHVSRMFQDAINDYGGTLIEDGYFGKMSREQLRIYQPNLDSIRIKRIRFIDKKTDEGKIDDMWRNGLIKRAYTV